MTSPDELKRRLDAAHAEALRVGDSTQRADQLARSLTGLVRDVEGAAEVPEDARKRIRAALADAERVLRRDEDGREAARHLQVASRLLGGRTERPSPF